MPNKFIEWVPAIVLFIAVIILIPICTSYGEDNDEPLEVEIIPTASPEPPPIRLLGLRVQETIVTPPGPATLINGICNDTEKPLIVEIYLVAQKRVNDPAISAESVALIEREQGRGIGRGRPIALDPGCHFEEPLPGNIPLAFTPGEWRLFLEAVVRNDALMVAYSTTEFSEYFRVVAP